MCGIYGFAGNKNADLAKMKILGLYNITRGRHSCGYYYDGVLRHGVDKLKEFDDFIADGMLINKPKSRGAKVFIGHTRHATKGAQTLENAHPFIVDGLVQVHNGTIENAFTMCNTYGIDHEKVHVDSLALAMLIKKEGWKILDQYIGYAANMWHFEHEPDTLYVYHGASRTKNNDKDLYEERPLWYMETRAGVYFSSLENSLFAIRDSEGEVPKKLPHNKVYKFTKGKLEGVVHTAARSEVNLAWLDPPPTKKKQSYHPPAVIRNLSPKTSDPQMNLFGEPPIAASLIWHEQKPAYIGNTLDRVYFYRGRYWRQLNSEKSGVFETLLNGRVKISKAGYIVKDGKKSAARGVGTYYFTDGVMLKDEIAYKTVCALVENNNHPLSYMNRIKMNFAYHISKFAMYPVTCHEGEGFDVIDDFRFRWWADQAIYTGTFEPPFSLRKYSVLKGRLMQVIRDSADIAFVKQAQVKEPEAVVTVEPPIKTLSDELDPVQVKKYMNYFNICWLNLSEIQDLPLPVYAAIQVYVDEWLDNKKLKSTVTQKERTEYYNEFIRTAVNDGISFLDNMDTMYQENLQYYVEVGMTEVRDEEERIAAEDEYNAGTVPDMSTTLVNNTGSFEDVAYEDVDTDSVVDVIDKQVETESVKKQYEEVINQIISLRKEGDRLDKLTNNPLAKDMAFCIYSAIDTFKIYSGNKIKDENVKRALAWIDIPF